MPITSDPPAPTMPQRFVDCRGAAFRAAGRCAAVAALLFLGACSTAVLSPVGPIGAANRMILLDSLAIMLAIVVPTILATLGVAWWFRASNARARRRPDWTFSGQIELVVWAIPVMVVMLLGGVTWIGSHQLDPAVPIASTKPTLHIQVVSLDWKWLFIYPDQHVATINELVVPAGVPVRFSITSASVMSAFFVPRLGSMIYAMNGMATQLHLRADEVGTLGGLSAMFNGDGFSDMHFAVRALDAPAFAAWVASTRSQGGAPLDAAGYAALARQSVNHPPTRFAAVAPDLFDRIVDQTLPPGPGPGLKSPGTAKSFDLEH